MQRGDQVVVLLAGFVVDQDALLDCFASQGFVDVLAFTSQLGGDFEGVVGRAAVTAGVASDQLQGIVIGGQSQSAEAALLVFQGAAEKSGDLLFGERLQDIDAAAGEQCRNDLEGGVLSGCADQANRPTLDVRQKGVLLRFIEAVNLIDEEDGPRVQMGGLCRHRP